MGTSSGQRRGTGQGAMALSRLRWARHHDKGSRQGNQPIAVTIAVAAAENSSEDDTHAADHDAYDDIDDV